MHVSPKIEKGSRYLSFFKNVIWIIDDTHISRVVTPSEQVRFIGRKDISRQNIMVACDCNMCFTFVLAGWEGIVHDAQIFNHVFTTPNMNFSHSP